MSRVVSEALKHMNELQDAGPDSELFHVKQDIERAINEAPLTEEERYIITALYFTDTEAPVRQGSSGRPRNPWASSLVSLDMGNRSENAKEIYVSRRLRSAIDKIAEHLGDDYNREEAS